VRCDLDLAAINGVGIGPCGWPLSIGESLRRPIALQNREVFIGQVATEFTEPLGRKSNVNGRG